VEPSKHSSTFTPPHLGEMLAPLVRDESFCARLAPRLGDLLNRDKYPTPTNLTHLAAEVLTAVVSALPDSEALSRPPCFSCLVTNPIFSLKCEINALVLLLESIKNNSLDINANTDRLSEWLEGYSSFLSNIQHRVHTLVLQLDGEEG